MVFGRGKGNGLGMWRTGVTAGGAAEASPKGALLPKPSCRPAATPTPAPLPPCSPAALFAAAPLTHAPRCVCPLSAAAPSPCMAAAGGVERWSGAGHWLAHRTGGSGRATQALGSVAENTPGAGAGVGAGARRCRLSRSLAAMQAGPFRPQANGYIQGCGNGKVSNKQWRPACT